MIKGLSHVCIKVKDLNKTIYFYTKVLGFKVVHRFKNKKKNLYGVFLKTGKSTFLEIFKTKHCSTRLKNNFHICFEVKWIKSLASRLHQRGYKTKICRGRTDNTLLLFIKDPDNYKIEFHEFDKASAFYKYLDK